MSAMQFGVTLPQIKRTWQEARAVAETVDALGFHSAWVCDHVYGVHWISPLNTAGRNQSPSKQ